MAWHGRAGQGRAQRVSRHLSDESRLEAIPAPVVPLLLPCVARRPGFAAGDARAHAPFLDSLSRTSLPRPLIHAMHLPCFYNDNNNETSAAFFFFFWVGLDWTQRFRTLS